MSLDDYGAMLRRRLWLIAVPAILGPIVGYAVMLFLTARYTSTSLILIEQPTVPENVVQSPTGNLFTRLANMQEQILSRSRLQPLIERYDLYRDVRKRSMEDAVQEMRDVTKIQTVTFAGEAGGDGSGRRPVPGFSISFTAESARLAQQVCTELTTMFLDENLKQQEARTQNTTDFLSGQLADAKRQLDEQDAKLAEFKRRNLGSLPDEQQANLQILSNLHTQLNAASDALGRAEQDRAYAQSLLQQQLDAWHASLSMNSPETLQDQLRREQEALTLLESRYTDDYPDVIKLKKDVVDLQKKIAHQPLVPSKPAIPQNATLEPPQIQQLRAQVRQDNEMVRTQTSERARLQKQINSYQGRIQMSPLVEQQFKELTLGHETALKFYNDLLASRNQSQMSADLQNRQQGETFRLLDSASSPEQPSFPIWWQFVLAGFGGGVALGLCLAFLFEYRDKALRDERDIEFYLDLPTLALVPAIDELNGRARKSFPQVMKRWKAEARERARA